MARLSNPHREELCKTDFEQYPVWVWDDENEGYLPLAKSEPYTSEYGTLFIKAIFETDLTKFDGYLVGIFSYYAFAFFLKDEVIVINLNMRNELVRDLESVFEILKCKPYPIFPLKYKTTVCIDNKGPISGQFIQVEGELFCVPDYAPVN